MNFKKRILSLVTIFVCGMQTMAAESKPINVLIVDGFSNHDWAHTTRCLKSILDSAGGFTIAVSTVPVEENDAWNPNFAAYDVVIQNCNALRPDLRWSRRVEKALETYVANGGGLYVFHSANNAFPAWEEYNKMIGLGWRSRDYGFAITLDAAGNATRVPPGEGERTSHGARVNAILTRVGDHPIHAGLPRKWIAADIEVYRYARGPAENLTVLSFSRDAKTQLDFPTEWVVDYGKGRVYSSTLGHVWHDQKDPEGMRCAGHQTLIPRVVQWLAKRPVDPSLPADFPTAEKRSLR